MTEKKLNAIDIGVIVIIAIVIIAAATMTIITTNMASAARGESRSFLCC